MSLAADPWLNFTSALPRAALVPLVVLWAGLGFEMKTVVVFLGGFFSIILPTVEGVRTVERQFLDVARSFRAGDLLILRTVVLPGTVAVSDVPLSACQRPVTPNVRPFGPSGA